MSQASYDQLTITQAQELSNAWQHLMVYCTLPVKLTESLALSMQYAGATGTNGRIV
jgi:hypothetical protein